MFQMFCNVSDDVSVKTRNSFALSGNVTEARDGAIINLNSNL
jgi:hypothetical protein